MGLSVGIVGLPNVGKSTLFNALLKKQASFAEASASQAGLAKVANFPFTTIEPNIGVVPVSDERLERLADVVAGISTSGESKATPEVSDRPPIVQATVEFLDIAGLIAGAHKGEGLGNKFLAHIREVDAICHVVRAFSDPDIIKEGAVDPKTDLEIVETELKLADFQTLEKQKDPGNTPDKELKKRWEVVIKLKSEIQKGTPAREINLSEEEAKIAKELTLLTSKPILVTLNVEEKDLANAENLEEDYAKNTSLSKEQIVTICAKTEAELAELTPSDQKEYLENLGVENSGLERLIKKAFSTLGLITFLTAGEKEVRAWTIKKDTNAQEASGVIHTDFMDKFIKADIVEFERFVEGGWKNAREKGYVRSEGRDYVMKEGDVVEFRTGS